MKNGYFFSQTPMCRAVLGVVSFKKNGENHKNDKKLLSYS